MKKGHTLLYTTQKEQSWGCVLQFFQCHFFFSCGGWISFIPSGFFHGGEVPRPLFLYMVFTWWSVQKHIFCPKVAHASTEKEQFLKTDSKPWVWNSLGDYISQHHSSQAPSKLWYLSSIVQTKSYELFFLYYHSPFQQGYRHALLFWYYEAPESDNASFQQRFLRQSFSFMIN